MSANSREKQPAVYQETVQCISKKWDSVPPFELELQFRTQLYLPQREQLEAELRRIMDKNNRDL